MWKHDRECCHFVPSSLYQWCREQGQHMWLKYQICPKPPTFFCSSFVMSQLRHGCTLRSLSSNCFGLIIIRTNNEKCRWKYLQISAFSDQLASSVWFLGSSYFALGVPSLFCSLKWFDCCCNSVPAGKEWHQQSGVGGPDTDQPADRRAERASPHRHPCPALACHHEDLLQQASLLCAAQNRPGSSRQGKAAQAQLLHKQLPQVSEHRVMFKQFCVEWFIQGNEDWVNDMRR